MRVSSAGGSTNLDASLNTFVNMTFSTTASNRYMIYNTGTISASNTYTGNTVANLTNSLNTIGSFFGIAHAAGESTGSLTMSNNTFTNNILTGTTGNVQLMSSSGAINNVISINSNTVANYSS